MVKRSVRRKSRKRSVSSAPRIRHRDNTRARRSRMRNLTRARRTKIDRGDKKTRLRRGRMKTQRISRRMRGGSDAVPEPEPEKPAPYVPPHLREEGGGGRGRGRGPDMRRPALGKKAGKIALLFLTIDCNLPHLEKFKELRYLNSDLYNVYIGYQPGISGVTLSDTETFKDTISRICDPLTPLFVRVMGNTDWRHILPGYEALYNEAYDNPLNTRFVMFSDSCYPLRDGEEFKHFVSSRGSIWNPMGNQGCPSSGKKGQTGKTGIKHSAQGTVVTRGDLEMYLRGLGSYGAQDNNLDEFYMNLIPSELTAHEVTYTHWVYNGYDVKGRIVEGEVGASLLTAKELKDLYDNKRNEQFINEFVDQKKGVIDTVILHGFFPSKTEFDTGDYKILFTFMDGNHPKVWTLEEIEAVGPSIFGESFFIRKVVDDSRRLRQRDAGKAARGRFG